MIPRKLLQACFVVILIFQQSKCYNILAVFNIPSRSLHLAALSMVQILVERGHNVTLVTAFNEKVKQSENFTHVYLEDTAKINEQQYSNFFDFQMSTYYIIEVVESSGIENCRATFQDSAFKKFIKSGKKFDLVIVDPYMSASLLYLSEFYQAPLMFYGCFDSNYGINPFVGNLAPPSFVPNIFLDYPSEMNFFQRLNNFFVYLLAEYVRNFHSLPGHDKVVKETFPEAPHISQYYHKGSVVLLNSDVSITDSIPKVPGMFHIGGFHITKPKPLPKDLKEIMDNAKHGVIFFSLGSNIKSSQMPKSRVQEILQIFSKLKEVIIWKWEDEDLPGKPSNVVVRKWLPQTDILAHKNIKLFITHGGLHSILETVHYGVPCVSLSVFMDQDTNSYKAVELGFAEWIPYKDFTAEKFENALHKTLTDPSYRNAAKERTKIMQDKPMTPQETVAFWTEYVVRHQGAKHLQVGGLKLHWYQYILLDVVLFTLCLFLLIMFIVKIAITSLFSKIFSRDSKTRRKKNL